MISSTRLLFIFTFVLIPHSIFGDELENAKSSDFFSIKRQHIQGKRLGRQQQQPSTEPPSNAGPQDNPCTYKELEKPNFNVPGRRISESKCQEYLWEINNRVFKAKRISECRTYHLKKSNYVPYTIGGRNTKPGEFPHMGAVGWRAVKGTWIFICGSSLISPKFMLTAAHCSKVSTRNSNVANTSPEIVRLGDKNIADVFDIGNPTVNINIQRINVHPRYDAPKKYFDIAIIELEEDVYINRYIQPACLWTKFDMSSLGRKAEITGWGVIETATLKTSKELQAANVDILDSSDCDRFLKPFCNRLWCGMSESQLCAGNLSGGVDACQGDSGGPLQVRIDLPSNTEGYMHFLIGVTSFGYGCAEKNTPAVYTRVSSFIDWIEDNVWLI